MSTGGPEPRWAAVVVTYNAGDLLEGCVRSVLADASVGRPEVVVVDNGSEDGSVERLATAGLPVEVVAAGRNLGYAGGANLGISRTTAPVVAVLNADTRLRPGTAGAVLARFDDPGVGAVGPLLSGPDGRPYPSARTVPSTLVAAGHGLLHFVWPRNPFTRRYRQLDLDPSRPREVDWVSGAAVWLRRSALDAVGGWDPGYFMYVEDVDLCWRLRRAGWRVVYEPGGEVEHVQGAMTGRHPYRMIAAHHRSLLRFAAKRWRGPRRLLLVPAAVFLAVRAVLAMIHHAVRVRRGCTGPAPVSG